MTSPGERSFFHSIVIFWDYCYICHTLSASSLCGLWLHSSWRKVSEHQLCPLKINLVTGRNMRTQCVSCFLQDRQSPSPDLLTGSLVCSVVLITRIVLEKTCHHVTSLLIHFQDFASLYISVGLAMARISAIVPQHPHSMFLKLIIHCQKYKLSFRNLSPGQLLRAHCIYLSQHFSDMWRLSCPHCPQMWP